MSEMTYRDAVRTALREALNEDSRVFLAGEDIGPYGGAYAVTKGLTEEFGPERIRDSPLSESVIVGAGVGAAMGGLRPIIEIMTINFTLLAMDQIVNHAAKMRYMSGGQLSVPLIIRTVTGGGASVGATHSQNFEGWYASVPGLKVVVPSTPHDVLGLLRASRDEEDPVLFVEHILLYSSRGEVPEDRYVIPLGTADVKRKGDHVTVVAYSKMVNIALEAAQKLAQDGIEAEVVDLRCLRPLDMETVLESVRKTHKVLVVEEVWRTGGVGAEIAAQIQEQAFDFLDAPISRLAGEEVPMPYSRPLEDAAIPNSARVVQSVESLLKG
jgi:pyruvate dehydrogenase E1 component beta subunit